MAAERKRQSDESRSEPVRFLVAFTLGVAVLYLGKPVVLPLALALLLTFVLTPLVVLVQKRGIPRIPAVFLVVIVTLIVAGTVSWGVGTQLTALAQDLPAHAGQVKEKIERIRHSGGGPVSRLLEAFKGIGDSEKPVPPVGQPAQAPVVVTEASDTAIQRLETVAAAVVEPLADAALVSILVIFMLIRREDLRNRVIGLLGHSRLTGTTRVFVHSAERISRLLLMQLCVNTGFGIIFGVSLKCIGVEYAFLWGFLAVVLRFIPFIGSWVAAAFPVLLSFAMSPGLVQPIVVFAVFLTLDVLTANAVEPLLFGHSTGVSPIALLIAAVFWSWVWGPIGLILSTPLTICMVVLGQHIPRFRFLSLLLGDQPALAPHVAFYQRLLAADSDEAIQVARMHVRKQGRETLADEVLIRALRLVRRDRLHAGLSAEDEAFIYGVVKTVTAEHCDQSQGSGTDSAPPSDLELPLAMGCAAHHQAEELMSEMLAGGLCSHCRMETISTRTLPSEIETRIAEEKPAIVFISVLPPGGTRQARYLSRRLHRRFPELKIIVGYFGKVKDFDKLLIRFRSSGASYVTTSLQQSCSQILALLPKRLSPAIESEPPSPSVSLAAS
jgi:predicted PurR-regulated permease PerM